jgi:peptidoglycan/xylan/chitin deacetylase (PgdA/CDA1 family)
MIEKKLLLITFDYELFLGERSGTVQECLILPTDGLLDCLEKYHFKAVFFIDTVYMLRLREMAGIHEAAKIDLKAIMDQLVKLVKKGHEIHPHIHPHWMDARYESQTNEWELRDKKHYTFASISPEQQVKLFDHSIHFVQSVLNEAKISQPVDAYRAGGWSIQPFSSFESHFKRHGIVHEFSVLPGRYFFSDAHQFDFRNAPSDLSVYHFSKDVCERDDQGNFTEWTISFLPMTRFQRWFDFKISGLMHRMGIKRKFSGSTVNAVITGEGDSTGGNKILRLMASFEGLNPYRVRKYDRRIRRLNYFQFISHPKLLGEFELKMMDLLFRKLRKISQLETDFRKNRND